MTVKCLVTMVLVLATVAEAGVMDWSHCNQHTTLPKAGVVAQTRQFAKNACGLHQSCCLKGLIWWTDMGHCDIQCQCGSDDKIGGYVPMIRKEDIQELTDENSGLTIAHMDHNLVDMHTPAMANNLHANKTHIVHNHQMYILTFHEPNCAKPDASQSTDESLGGGSIWDIWYAIQEIALECGGRHLVGPSVNCGKWSAEHNPDCKNAGVDSPDSGCVQWYQDFLRPRPSNITVRAKTHKLDYAALHIFPYCGDPNLAVTALEWSSNIVEAKDKIMAAITSIYDLTAGHGTHREGNHLQVWLTAFSCSDTGTAEQHNKLLEIILPELVADDRVYRYAWNIDRNTEDANVQSSWHQRESALTTSSVVNGIRVHKLTTVGECYMDHQNHVV